MKNPFIIDHPLVQHKISILKDKNTGSKEFRELISEISMLMCYEATRDLPLKEVEIETPLSISKTKFISGRKLAFVPILRAGLGMIDGVLQLVPTAKMGHIGIYRHPETFEPIEYYCKLPIDISKREVIILDPMLATGCSIIKSIEILKQNEVKNIKFMCIVAAPQGVENLNKKYPDVQIYCASLDEDLNKNGYIIPGLGDAGDRLFGTK